MLHEQILPRFLQEVGEQLRTFFTRLFDPIDSESFDLLEFIESDNSSESEDMSSSGLSLSDVRPEDSVPRETNVLGVEDLSSRPKGSEQPNCRGGEPQGIDKNILISDNQ